MEYRILGPMEVHRDGRELRLGGPKQRAVLAMLLLANNEVVSRDRLIDGLWGERPPTSAAHTLDDYVSRLRKLLGPARIARRAPGYVFQVEPGELDRERFELLFRQGREALTRGDPSEAEALLEAALELWRGVALADILFEPFAQAEAERLEERRMAAVEERIEAGLALGREADLIPELEQLVRDNPWRERPLSQLMLALYRAGRQTEALVAFQTARKRLAQELGLEPSPALRELERKILAHDHTLRRSLVGRIGGEREPMRSRKGVLIAGLAAATAVVAGAAAVLVLLSPGGSSTSAARSLVASQLVGLSASSGARVEEVPLRGAPTAMAADGRSLWLADADGGTVSRVDLDAGALVEQIPLGGNPGLLAIGGGSAWVAGLPGSQVTRIDTATQAVTQRVGLGGASAAAVGSGAGGIWIADTTDDTLIELDPATGGVRRTITVDLRPTSLAIGGGAIWAADYDSNSVAEVDPRSGRTIQRVAVGRGPTALAVGRAAVWVASTLDSTVSRIDPTHGSVAATIPVGSGPLALALAHGSVWVANQYSGTISQIDPVKNRVVRTTSVGGVPTAITSADGKLWVGIRPRVLHRGGTLVMLHTTPISIDPAVQFSVPPFQTEGLTDDGLVTFNHEGGPNGLQLVPDLAISLPVPTDGGTTYTFRLRPGIRYSDGRFVHPADFRRAIERVFLVRALDRDLLSGIVGAAACSAPSATRCDLRQGILTDDRDRTVTFLLAAPDPQFLTNLTNGGISMPVPAGTPMRDAGYTPIPGTGPYKVASADRHHIRYVRNSRFREWSHAAQPDGNPDEIVWRFGLSAAQEVREIQQGHADWMADPVPARLLPTLERRFASQLKSYPSTDTEFLKFNTNLPPFDDVRVRRAVNLAIDRHVFVRSFGGPEAADPTCQLLPPGVPGYRRYCPYTRSPTTSGTWTGPDLARARRLVAASATRGAKITVWGWSDDPYSPPHLDTYLASLLRNLGYQVRVRLVTHASLHGDPGHVFRTIPLLPFGWLDIAAANFFVPWVSCTGAANHSWFCVPRLDREMRRARSVEATTPRAAAHAWNKIDRAIVDRAALVPLVNLRQIDFVSTRVHNFHHHPYLDFIADQASVRQ